MTNPVDITQILPSKAKAWVGLVGSLLTFAVPYVLEVTKSLPGHWPVLVGGVLACLTGLGIVQAPYKPAGTVLAPDTPAVAEAAKQTPPPAGGPYRNPWR